MDGKHHKNGSPFPPHKDNDVWRVYSMALCPYAHRTLLAMEYKQIPYEVVNINLKNKPDWFLARTPVGLVPLLEKGEQRVFDSTICNYFLEEQYPADYNLLPANPYDRARVRMLVEQFATKVIPKFYEIIRENQNRDTCAQLLPRFQEQLMIFEDALCGKFFGGDSMGMLDIQLWPFFERFGCLDILLEKQVVPESKFPKLYDWKRNMYETPAVRAVMHDDSTHAHFARTALAGNPDYDLERM